VPLPRVNTLGVSTVVGLIASPNEARYPMTLLFLALCGLSVVVGCLCGRFLAWPLAFVLAVIAAVILPIAATVLLVWPPQERTFRGIVNNGWFSDESAGFLAIPWIVCLVFAIVGVIAGRWLRRANKI
jgi:hypothetical protein